MRNLAFGASVALSVLFSSCGSTEKELVGSWKRTEFLDPADEPTTDYRDGFILDLNEDLSFNMRYTKPGGRERKKKGTWAVVSSPKIRCVG
jgi:hypothetical protein